MENIEELNRIALTMSTIPVCGRTHVIRPVDGGTHNYEGTGQALIGVLEVNQSFGDFKKMWIHYKLNGVPKSKLKELKKRFS